MKMPPGFPARLIASVGYANLFMDCDKHRDNGLQSCLTTSRLTALCDLMLTIHYLHTGKGMFSWVYLFMLTTLF